MAADEKNLNNLISLKEASRISGLSSVHLRNLVAKIKLWGKRSLFIYLKRNELKPNDIWESWVILINGIFPNKKHQLIQSRS
jgi:hypothetical protein